MSKLKLLLAAFAVMLLTAFASASPASAHTAAETLSCMNSSLSATPFKGTYGQRLRHARHLAVKTDLVAINGTPIGLDAGQSIWSQCKGPTLAEQLASANAEIRDLKAQISRKDNRIAQLRTDNATWQNHSADQDMLIAALEKRPTWGSTLVLMLLAIVAVGVTGAVLSRKRRSVPHTDDRRPEPRPEPAPAAEEPAPAARRAPRSDRDS